MSLGLLKHLVRNASGSVWPEDFHDRFRALVYNRYYCTDPMVWYFDLALTGLESPGQQWPRQRLDDGRMNVNWPRGHLRQPCGSYIASAPDLLLSSVIARHPASDGPVKSAAAIFTVTRSFSIALDVLRVFAMSFTWPVTSGSISGNW